MGVFPPYRSPSPAPTTTATTGDAITRSLAQRCRRAQAGEAVVAQRRARVVRLVDDHHRAVPVHQVGEAALDLAQVGAAEVGLDLEVALAHALETGQLGGALEMRLEVLLVGIHVAPRAAAEVEQFGIASRLGERAEQHAVLTELKKPVVL